MYEALPAAYEEATQRALEAVARRPHPVVVATEQRDYYRAVQSNAGGLELALGGIMSVHKINTLIVQLGYDDPAFFFLKQAFVEEREDALRRHMRRGSGIQEESWTHRQRGY